MAYRLDNTPPPKPENMLPRFEVRNGAISIVAFPCFYLDVVKAHDSNWHDHKGWPAPNYHDESCQFVGGIPLHEHAGEWEWVDFAHPHPIDLLSDYEGYTDAYLVLDEEVEGLYATAEIDEAETNTVYMRVTADLEFFEDKPKDFRFTIFAHAPARVYKGVQEDERVDQVIRGMITVLPGNTM